MFTGIVEGTGKLISIVDKGTSVDLEIQADFIKEIKVDQSISHNGVCLTVTQLKEESYFVTAIPETLKKTNLGTLKSGDKINLERCMKAGGRYDGHIVQGHVDQTGVCIDRRKEGDSHIFTIQYDEKYGNFTVEKGSVCLNGISLTVFDSQNDRFSVAVIPYTFEYTNMNFLRIDDIVNIEFDILGKYLHKLFLKYQSNR